MNLSKICIGKPYSFLVNDTTLTSNNPFCFRRDLIERIWKLSMTIDDKIGDEKRQYNLNREAAKISASSSGKIDKYEYLTGGEILFCDQCWMIDQGKFVYSTLGKALKEQTKTIEDKKRKQVEALKILKPGVKKLIIKDVIPKDQLNEEAIAEIYRIKETEKMVNREASIFETSKYVCNFQQFETIRFLAKNILDDKITLDSADEDQSN